MCVASCRDGALELDASCLRTGALSRGWLPRARVVERLEGGRLVRDVLDYPCCALELCDRDLPPLDAGPREPPQRGALEPIRLGATDGDADREGVPPRSSSARAGTLGEIPGVTPLAGAQGGARAVRTGWSGKTQARQARTREVEHVDDHSGTAGRRPARPRERLHRRGGAHAPAVRAGANRGGARARPALLLRAGDRRWQRRAVPRRRAGPDRARRAAARGRGACAWGVLRPDGDGRGNTGRELQPRHAPAVRGASVLRVARRAFR